MSHKNQWTGTWPLAYPLTSIHPHTWYLFAVRAHTHTQQNTGLASLLATVAPLSVKSSTSVCEQVGPSVNYTLLSGGGGIILGGAAACQHAATRSENAFKITAGARPLTLIAAVWVCAWM